MKKIKIYAKSIAIPVIVGAIIGIIISKFIDYNVLIKPKFAPPSIAFPIVWSILYIVMGISYGILKSNNLTEKNIDAIYYMQLFFNAMWSIFFFMFKWRLFSFLWLIILDVLVFIMIYKFYEKNKTAGLIQIPYMIWVLFASYLNISIYLLNK